MLISPGGDAGQLNRSIKTVLALPSKTRLFMRHNYGVGEDEFVAVRNARDDTLAMPRLIIPSLKVNMKAGRLR